MNLQLQDERYHALSRYEAEHERNLLLDNEVSILLQDLESLKVRIKEVSRENTLLQREKNELQ